ncbi:MAG: hypothetical protein AAB576_07045, partial [Elusimicrobiota bacterium]
MTGLEPFTTYYFALRAEDSGGLVGKWLRDGSERNTTNFTVPLFVPMAPDAVTNLSALPGSAEGEIALSWSAPRNQNFVAMASYEVRFATYPAAAGGVDNWFTSAVSSSVLVSSAKKPGALQTLVIGGLKPSATFYFGVKGFDRIGEASPLDLRAASGDQAFAKPLNLPPSIPAGLKALEGINKAFVSWNDLSGLGKGLDFQEYRLYRSTAAGMGFERVLSTAVLAYTDKPLAPWTTYYYKLSSADEENLESAFSSTYSVVPYTLPPQEPFGIRQSISSNTLTLSWNPTTRFGDSSLFESTSTPSADELLGYQILRSTDPCAPFSPLSALDLSSTTFMDVTNGKSFLYQIHSFNSLGFSTGALTVTSLGDQFFYIEDCITNLKLGDKQLAQINKETSGLSEDVFISRRMAVEEVGGKILQAVEFTPLMG